MEGCFTSYIMKMKYSCCTKSTSKAISSNDTRDENQILSLDPKNYSNLYEIPDSYAESL